MPRNGKLAPRWERWRRNRHKELLLSGQTEATSAEFSLLEAMGRQRIARTMGLRAAMQAELRCEKTSDCSDEFFLVVHPNRFEQSGRDADEQGPGSEAPAKSPAERARETDRDWFAANPGRNFRIRAMIPGELFPDPRHTPVPQNGEKMAEAVMKIAALSAKLLSGIPTAPPGLAHFVFVQQIAEGARLRSHLLLSDQLWPGNLTEESTEMIAVAFGKSVLTSADVFGDFDTGS